MKLFAPIVLLLCTTPICAGAQERPVVAVFSIATKNMHIQQQTLEGMGDYLSTLFAEGGAYQVIPKDTVKRTLLEQKAQSYKECYSSQCQIEVGKELAANASLSPQIFKVGSRCIVTLKLYDLRVAASKAAASARGGCEEDEVLISLERAAQKLLNATSPAVVTPAKQEKPTIPSPRAISKPKDLMSLTKLSANDASARTERRRDQAINELKKLIPKAGSRKAEMLFRMAQLYWQKSLFKRAHQKPQDADRIKQSGQELFKKVLKNYPTYLRNDEVYYHLGFAEHEDGKSKKALQYYWMMIKQFPYSPYVPHAYYHLGEILRDQGKISKARKAFERAQTTQDSKISTAAQVALRALP